ncbi:hypothetical protein [Crassaminicella indica]|nr:hypothetical protein [Crassaminicella indica]
MSKNDRLVIFTSSNKDTSEDKFKETLLKILQIHFDKEIKSDLKP